MNYFFKILTEMNVAFIFKEQCGYNVVLIILSSKTVHKTCSQFFVVCDGVLFC